MMHARIEKEVEGKVVAKKEIMVEDAYKHLIRAEGPTRGAARVSIGYGESTEFGREKYNVNVTLTCDQDAETLESATRLAVQTVKEMHAIVAKELLER